MTARSQDSPAGRECFPVAAFLVSNGVVPALVAPSVLTVLTSGLPGVRRRRSGPEFSTGGAAVHPFNRPCGVPDRISPPEFPVHDIG
ncbi:hypothetical protein FAIPA1_80035 [Frankia sp. AiPs1]